MTAFTLHPRLEADSLHIADLALSQLRLMRDARWPWLVLVPRGGASEVHDLGPRERALLVEETAEAGRTLKELTGAAKINVGALGNLVSQLHVHVVARRTDDPAWPGPVWGFGAAEPYGPGEAEAFAASVAAAMVRA